MRPGYDAMRHMVSQLATGPGAWVQVADFWACGVLLLAFALGLRMAIKGQRGAVGAPLLLGLVGVALVVAGAFTTDPALGYPPGAAAVQTTQSWIHGLAALAAFGLLGVAALVMAWHSTAGPKAQGWRAYSIVVGALLLAYVAASFIGVVPDAVGGLVQRIAIIGGLAWVAMVAVRLLRQGPAGA